MRVEQSADKSEQGEEGCKGRSFYANSFVYEAAPTHLHLRVQDGVYGSKPRVDKLSLGTWLVLRSTCNYFHNRLQQSVFYCMMIILHFTDPERMES